MNNEPVGTVIETEEIYGHTFKKRKSKIVQWLKKVDVGTLLYVNPSKEDEGKVCARCGAIAYDPVIKQTSKELTDEEILELTKDSSVFEYREFDDDMVRFARAIEERHGIK